MSDTQPEPNKKLKIIEEMVELRREIAEEEREKEENTAKINELQARNDEIDNILDEKKTLLIDYGKIRYTESLLDEMVDKEILESKKMNLQRIKEELMRGDISAEKVIELLRLDSDINIYIKVTHKETFVSKIGKNFSKRGW